MATSSIQLQALPTLTIEPQPPLRAGIAFVPCAECGAAADLARVVDLWDRAFCDRHATLAVVRGAA